MNQFSDVEKKISKNNKILFSKESLCLQDLIKLIESQNHRTLILWALDCGMEGVKELETLYPKENRPRKALELCNAWSRGDIKMALAKKAILETHALAKDIDDKVCIALCHAIGHAGATVHVGTHALGLPMYELTAIVLSNGCKGYEEEVTRKIAYYFEKLKYWEENEEKIERPWAKFLL